MSSKLEREVNRISNLKQNKDLSVDELASIAKINLILRDFKNNQIFTDTTEQKLAEEKFTNYLKYNEIESSSDIDTLISLVYNQIFERRIQGELNKLAEEGKYPPEKLTKQLTDIQNQKSSLKLKLDIDRKEDEKYDLSAYQLLHKRVDKYINNHKEEFSFGLGFECEKCQHKNWDTFLMYKRVKDFDSVIKHPWFIGRFLCNYEILKDVKDGKITKEQAIRYHICSGEGNFYKPSSEDRKWCVDYIDYLLENWVEITDLLNKN